MARMGPATPALIPPPSFPLNVPERKPLITVLRYDTKLGAEYYETNTMDEIVKNPNGLNLEFFAMHVINSYRVAKGLKPVNHFPVGKAGFDKKTK